MTATLVVSVVGPVLVVLAGWLVGQRRTSADVGKTSAEDKQITVNTALSVVALLRSELAEVRVEVGELRERVAVLERQAHEDANRIALLTNGVRILASQVVELGHRPRWTLDLGED